MVGFLLGVVGLWLELVRPLCSLARDFSWHEIEAAPARRRAHGGKESAMQMGASAGKIGPRRPGRPGAWPRARRTPGFGVGNPAA